MHLDAGQHAGRGGAFLGAAEIEHAAYAQALDLAGIVGVQGAQVVGAEERAGPHVGESPEIRGAWNQHPLILPVPSKECPAGPGIAGVQGARPQRLRLPEEEDEEERFSPLLALPRLLALLLPRARSLCAWLFWLLARAPMLPASERLMPPDFDLLFAAIVCSLWKGLGKLRRRTVARATNPL